MPTEKTPPPLFRPPGATLPPRNEVASPRDVGIGKGGATIPESAGPAGGQVLPPRVTAGERAPAPASAEMPAFQPPEIPPASSITTEAAAILGEYGVGIEVVAQEEQAPAGPREITFGDLREMVHKRKLDEASDDPDGVDEDSWDPSEVTSQIPRPDTSGPADPVSWAGDAVAKITQRQGK